MDCKKANAISITAFATRNATNSAAVGSGVKLAFQPLYRTIKSICFVLHRSVFQPARTLPQERGKMWAFGELN